MAAPIKKAKNRIKKLEKLLKKQTKPAAIANLKKRIAAATEIYRKLKMDRQASERTTQDAGGG